MTTAKETYWYKQATKFSERSNSLHTQLCEARKALRDLLDHYTRLVESGDAGNWDCEKEPQVIAARAVLRTPDRESAP
jgi:hypothetical protein